MSTAENHIFDISAAYWTDLCRSKSWLINYNSSDFRLIITNDLAAALPFKQQVREDKHYELKRFWTPPIPVQARLLRIQAEKL